MIHEGGSGAIPLTNDDHSLTLRGQMANRDPAIVKIVKKLAKEQIKR